MKIPKIQCFQTPHTPTFGAMTFVNLGGVCRTKICDVFGGRQGPRSENKKMPGGLMWRAQVSFAMDSMGITWNKCI